MRQSFAARRWLLYACRRDYRMRGPAAATMPDQRRHSLEVRATPERALASAEPPLRMRCRRRRPTVYPIAFVGESRSEAATLLSRLALVRVDANMAAPIAFSYGSLEFSARYFSSPRAAARSAARAAMIVAVFAVDSPESWAALLDRWRPVLQARRRHMRGEQPALVLVANRRNEAPAHVSDADAYGTARAYDVDLHVAVNSDSAASARALGALLCREILRKPLRYEPFMIAARTTDDDASATTDDDASAATDESASASDASTSAPATSAADPATSAAAPATSAAEPATSAASALSCSVF